MKRFMLLTGRPGVGKTTLAKEIVALYSGSAGGFYTEEIREGGKRTGFDIVTLDGRRASLARAEPGGRHRVGRYRVNVEAVSGLGAGTLRDTLDSGILIVVDEIGKMELFSQAFRDAIEDALRMERCLLGTILMSGHPWADVVKSDPHVEVIEVTRENHREIRKKTLDWLKGMENG